MTADTKDLTVRRSIVVAAPQARAFLVFTGKMASWWPATHHLGKAPFEQIVVEPRAGGRWYERAADGSECEWGSVLAWEPNERVVFSWHLNGEWKHDPDPARASEVEIRFVPRGPDETEVQLVHRGIERHVAAMIVFDGVGAPGGWAGVLAGFAERARAA